MSFRTRRPRPAALAAPLAAPARARRGTARRVGGALALAGLLAGTGALAAPPASALTAAGTAPPAQLLAGPAYTFAGVANYDRDRNPDIVARENATGRLWLYPGAGTRGYSPVPRVQIGNGWNGFTFAGLADYDHDGRTDIVARDNRTGLLWLYPGVGARGYSPVPRVQIGNGWNGFTFAGLADYDGDGKVDIVARNNATGNLMLYPGIGARGYSPVAPVQIGNGWNGYTFAGLADYDHDGKVDIVARNNATGNLMLYPGIGARGYSPVAPVQIGNGWNGFTFAGLSDYDRDGKVDIVARHDTDRRLWLYPGIGARGYSPVPPVQIGNGW